MSAPVNRPAHSHSVDGRLDETDEAVSIVLQVAGLAYCDRFTRTRASPLRLAPFSGHLRAGPENLRRGPVTFDVRQHRPDLVVRQHIAERRHVALIVRWGRVTRNEAVFCDPQTGRRPDGARCDQSHHEAVLAGDRLVVGCAN